MQNYIIRYSHLYSSLFILQHINDKLEKYFFDIYILVYLYYNIDTNKIYNNIPNLYSSLFILQPRNFYYFSVKI